jgi:transcriptional regulator with XRE-family HTH domain
MDGEALKQLRLNVGLTQDEFAQRILGISQAALSQFERGVRPVPPARARQIQRLLGRPAEPERE